MRQTLIAAGIASPATTDIGYDTWRKLTANLCGSALCLILREVTAVLGSATVNPLAWRAREEVLAVAAAYGVVLDDSPERRFGPQRGYPDHRPSILQDYELGRPMEIESIVRTPVAFARSAGIATPTLDAIEAICVRLGAAKGLYTP